MLISFEQALATVTAGIVPLVFYGTAFSLVVKYLLNFIFCLFFIMILRKDAGY